MSPYLFLAGAIVAEVIATTSLKLSEGMTRWVPAVAVVVGYVVAFWLLSQALRDLPVGFAYAVWAGAGTALVAIIGLLLFGETFSLLKGIGIAMIIGGVIALNVSGGH